MGSRFLVCALLFGAQACVFDASGVSADGGVPSLDAADAQVLDQTVGDDAPDGAQKDAAPGDADSTLGDTGVDGPGPDVGGDTAPVTCKPGDLFCQGRLLRTCNASGNGPDPSKDVTCLFTCGGDTCVLASNLPASAYTGCDSTAPPLTPPQSATVIFEYGMFEPRIACSPHCGDGSTTSIKALDTASNPDMAWFCLSELSIPAGMTVTAEEDIPEALILLVDGAAVVSGTIDLDGWAATAGQYGAGGPGGGGGGDHTAVAGNDGDGPCPGIGGERQGGSNDRASGGGGGGGFGGKGGSGGDGRNPGDWDTGAGGSGGGTCGTDTLVQLWAGSGGGSGGDGTCSADCGWAGGGGGGGIQIASRVSVTISASGTISAEGGAGYGVSSGVGSGGGAGGGGSGGAILLEAPLLSVAGALSVAGGEGGPSGSGAGGTGGSGATLDGSDGADYKQAGEGGSGGGGGGGRIRLNTPGGTVACGAFASPAKSCTSGALTKTP